MLVGRAVLVLPVLGTGYSSRFADWLLGGECVYGVGCRVGYGWISSARLCVCAYVYARVSLFWVIIFRFILSVSPLRSYSVCIASFDFLAIVILFFSPYPFPLTSRAY